MADVSAVEVFPGEVFTVELFPVEVFPIEVFNVEILAAAFFFAGLTEAGGFCGLRGTGDPAVVVRFSGRF
jgi:hypothetical protein